MAPGRCVDLRGKLSHLFGERVHCNRLKNFIQVKLPLLRDLWSCGAPESMLELNHADSGKQDVRDTDGGADGSEKFANGLPAALRSD